MTKYDSITILNSCLTGNNKITMIYRILFAALLFVVLPFIGLLAGPDPVSPTTDSTTTGADQLRLTEFEKKLTRSPNYKTSNAAGRLAVFDRTAPAANKITKERPAGPAYKNRKLKSALAVTVTPAPRPRSSGLAIRTVTPSLTVVLGKLLNTASRVSAISGIKTHR